MALSLKLSSNIVNYTSLNLSDASGIYDVSLNPTGWGSPNKSISDVTSAELTITLPNGSVVVIDVITDLGIDFATATTTDLVYNIPYSLLSGGVDGLMPDGVYFIEYDIIADGEPYGTTAYIMTYYVVQESVYNRIKLIPQYYTCSDCNNSFVKETSTIFMLLQALIASSQYSNTTRFEELLAGLTDIMSFDSSNCTSCGC